MNTVLAGELVEMAEAQFDVQAPLAELVEEYPAFAAWVLRVRMPITGAWEDADGVAVATRGTKLYGT